MGTHRAICVFSRAITSASILMSFHNVCIFTIRRTGVSEWNAPFDPSWNAEVTAAGEVCFVNATTGVTQWDCPCISGESEI